jgi:YidC/Oxa1 family membrane protein insertase
MDVRRVLLFFALSLLSLYAYSEIVRRLYGSAPARRPVETVERSAERAAEPAARAPREAAPPPARVIEGKTVAVETDLYRAEWTTAGARLTSFRLKRYRTSAAPESPPLELLRLREGDPRPLGVALGPGDLDDGRVAYTADAEALTLTEGETGTLVFSGSTAGGVEIQKEFRFEGGAYLIDMRVRIGGGAATAETTRVELTANPGPESGGGWFGGYQTDTLSVVALDGNRLEQQGVAGLDAEPLVFEAPVWGGFADRYFITVAIPEGERGGRIVASRSGATGAGVVRVEEPLNGRPAEGRMRLYFGPKDLVALEQAYPALRRAVDFGIFWFVAVPLHWCLVELHSVSGNYGLDIILLSALIKILFLPLTRKSMESMRAMQKLQPEMTKIRERYKDDAQRMQKEMMELYRRHRVNPLSGCLPMLLQLPVFVGLYNTLLNAIELRHAPFVWWIKDLSSPERLHVAGVGLPILAIAMGASMLVQQWMAPPAGDPAQRRMMMIMPVIFTFMFINFPSGLVLYWLVNNVLTIIQQYFVLKGRTGGQQ